MTILEAITQADLIRPNTLDAAIKLRWLSTLDGQIHAELLCGDREASAAFTGYGEETELKTTRLLVPYPYDELYVLYLLMRIDLEHGELDRYNNDAARFNRLWQSYAGRYCRTAPLKETVRLRF